MSNDKVKHVKPYLFKLTNNEITKHKSNIN